MDEKSISNATRRNFEKLNKNIEKHEFSSRANKRDSKKTIIPIEYYDNVQNIEIIDKIVEKFKGKNITKSVNTLIIAFLIQKKLVEYKSKLITSNNYIKDFIHDLDYYDDSLDVIFPEDERDPLGIIYQQLLTEGEKNKKGSYYTPKTIVNEILSSASNSVTYCDPCCGTGGFLIEALQYFKPENIYGYDIDINAVNISRTNLFIRNPEINYNSNVSCKNFLLDNDNQKYDFIGTNPPWGSMNDSSELPLLSIVKSGESFSYFLESALKRINAQGIVSFLLPISILNVKVHNDIRKLIITDYRIEEVREYGKCFKGVLTDVVSLTISNEKILGDYDYSIVDIKGKRDKSSISYVANDKNNNILLLTNIDSSIINKIISKNDLNLKNAQFALGIVTGDNKNQVKTEYEDGLSKIITGKEVYKYYNLPIKNYIKYDRTKFQQVCPDYFFQVQSKFIYKFISKKMVFFLDEDKCLTLNSANMMVLPDNFYLNKYVVLALLNSDLFNFYFIKKVGQVKILKEDIQNLPLPKMSLEIQDSISLLVRKHIENQDTNFDDVESLIFAYYSINDDEIKRIKEVVYGRVK